MKRSLPHVVRQAQIKARKEPELKKYIFDQMRQLTSFSNPDELIRWLYEEVDRLIATHRDLKNSTCHKGCHFCCYHPISLSPKEMNYLNRTKPDYSEARLKIQYDHFNHGAPINYEQRACIYLDKIKGECSVYKNRPLICRLTHVVTEPVNCHYENDTTPIEHLPLTQAALLIGAFYMVYPEVEIIPTLIKEESVSN